MLRDPLAVRVARWMTTAPTTTLSCPVWLSRTEGMRPDAGTVSGPEPVETSVRGTASCTFSVANAYTPGTVITRQVRGGDSESLYLDLRGSYGWYDLSVNIASDTSFVRRLAGHVETGKTSMSDPALGS